MSENRPVNCRFRLYDEGKAYPKSGCQACGKGIFSGLGDSCSKVNKPESKPDEKFVISIVNDKNGSKKYLELDHGFGYFFTSCDIHAAVKWDSFKSAKDSLDDLRKQEDVVASDGTKYPPEYLQNGLGIDGKNPSASGRIFIEKVVIVTEEVHVIDVSGKIQKPTGYKYD